MSFFTKATIRAFAAPNHRLSCGRRLYGEGSVTKLEQRTGRRHESGAFLLGMEREGRREVREVIFYDELDPGAYSTRSLRFAWECLCKTVGRMPPPSD